MKNSKKELCSYTLFKSLIQKVRAAALILILVPCIAYITLPASAKVTSKSRRVSKKKPQGQSKSSESPTPIPGSKAYVVTDINDRVLYPRTTSPSSAYDTLTDEFKADLQNAGKLPRVHSWLGGALWGTNRKAPGKDFKQPNPDLGSWNDDGIQGQGGIFTDLTTTIYFQNPAIKNFAPNETGISIAGVYPYLENGTVWLQNALNVMPEDQKQYWQSHAPMNVKTNPLIGDLRIVPSGVAPPAQNDFTPAYYPGQNGGRPNMLIDRQGDFDVDVVYQNDTNPYKRTPVSDATGAGEYIKLTISQGSPFMWGEARATPFLVFRDVAPVAPTELKPLTGFIAPQPVPNTNGISVAILYSNVTAPAPAGKGNDPGNQDNWRFYAIYFNSQQAQFTGFTGDNPQQKDAASLNSYLKFNNPQAKNWFVVAVLPVQRSYTSTRIQADTGVALQYAQAIGQYAFNFPTDTTIDYDVPTMDTVNTTFSVALAPVYGNTASGTIFTLPRHQYEPISIGNIPGTTTPLIIDPLKCPACQGANPADLKLNSANYNNYWSIRGELKAVAIPATQQTSQYVVSYPFNNYLPGFPIAGAAAGSSQAIENLTYKNSLGVDVTNKSNSIGSDKLGAFLLAALNWEFVKNAGTLISPNPPPAGWYPTWGVNVSQEIGSFYSSQYSFVGLAQDLSLLHSLNQYVQTTPDEWKTAATATWVGGAIPPYNQHLPSIAADLALKDSVEGLQNTLKLWFGPDPNGNNPSTSQKSGAQPVAMQNFLYYDRDLGFAILYPSSSQPAGGSSFPGFSNTTNTYGLNCNPPATTICATSLFEGFGSATKFTDGAYAIGGWVTGAAISSIFENSTGAAAASQWGQDYGAAIDLLVMGVAYDEKVKSWKADPAQFKFSKMPYFDQWAGHNWTTGILGGGNLFQGGDGHNENSISESSLAYSSIIMWGLATGRQDIAKLGIYLYTTQSFAADYYFFDKTNAYRPAQKGIDRNAAGGFTPLTTNAFNFYDQELNFNTSYPAGVSQMEYGATGSADLASPISSVNQLNQSSVIYATDFGGFPQAQVFIQSVPSNPWLMAGARNAEYWYQWNAALDNDNYRAWADFDLLKNADARAVYDYSYQTQMLVNQALGGYGTPLDRKGQTTIVPYPGAAKRSSKGSSPYQFWLDLMTIGNTGSPPFPPFNAFFLGDQSSPLLTNALGDSKNDKQKAFNYSSSNSMASMINALWTLENYGPPDWTIVGRPKNAADPFVFTAAFAHRDVSPGATTAGPVKTTLMVFNPNTQPVDVNFVRLDDTTKVIATILQVPAKKWAITTLGDGIGLPQASPCDTVCLRSPGYYLLNLNKFPRGSVTIGGVNHPVSTTQIDRIRLALNSDAAGGTTLQRFNRHYVAAQLSLLWSGGASAGAMRAHLSCYGLDFAPVRLSNGHTLRPGSTLGELFEQSRSAAREYRTADLAALADLFAQMNGDDPTGRCR